MEMLTTKEVMELLKVSRPTINRYINKGMPVIRVNKNVIRFEKEKVIHWFKTQNY